jgi:hypothetical protein
MPEIHFDESRGDGNQICDLVQRSSIKPRQSNENWLMIINSKAA